MLSYFDFTTGTHFSQTIENAFLNEDFNKE